MPFIRLHIGCGTKYLVDAVNIDIKGRLAEYNPELAIENSVTLDNYYPIPLSVAMKTARLNPRPVIVDELDSATSLLKYSHGSVDEIVAIQVLEHLYKDEAIDALGLWCNLLKRNGRLLISVPDVIGTARKLLDTQNAAKFDFYMRHIYGTQIEGAGVSHAWGYSKASLSNALFDAGFKRVLDVPSIHDYPAIMFEAYK